jgi:5-methylcytosine-specific restriction endonuclease McrA
MAASVDTGVIALLRGDPCAYCGSRLDITVDHIEPLAAGGEHHFDNLTAACRPCNASKRHRSFLMFLLDRRPVLAELLRLAA